MAATIKLDTIKDSGINIVLGKVQIIRTAYVSGIDTTGASVSGRLYKVLAIAGMPQWNDAHPDEPNARIRGINVIPQGSHQCEVRFSYEWERPIWSDITNYLYEVGTQLVTEETSYDKDGKLIQVKYYQGAEPSGCGGYSQTAVVRKLVPMSQIRASRLEYASPGATSRAYVGTVNNNTWGAGAKRTWLCTGIDGTSTDSGSTYKVSYTFSYRPEGWDSYVFFFDHNGRIPCPIVNSFNARTPTDLKGVGWTKAQLYPEANFSAQFGNP